MLGLSQKSSSSSILLTCGLSMSAIAPFFYTLPTTAQTNFSDVSFNYWARPFIEKLSEKGIIKGFPDGRFKPDEPVTRAQFAAIVSQAFEEEATRQYRGFNDVPANHWAQTAIGRAYSTRFLSGYPGNLFEPNQEIPKVQALVSLSSGLDLAPEDPTDLVLAVYRDASAIPGYADKGVAAATEAGIVVNYPNVKFLNPNQEATRAEIAAYVYQALVDQGDLEPIPQSARANDYIVKLEGSSQTPTNPSANTGQLVIAGTQIQVKYPGPNKVNLIVAPGETIQTTLEVAEDIKSTAGNVLIPKGSLISGRLVPVNVNNTTPGTQFVADQLKIATRNYNFSATSNPLVAISSQSVKPTDVQGAVGTAAAQAILGSLLGGSGFNLSSLINVLGGTTSNSTNASSVIVVDPTALVLTTQTPINIGS